jgi:hypothetical protein
MNRKSPNSGESGYEENIRKSGHDKQLGFATDGRQSRQPNVGYRSA